MPRKLPEKVEVIDEGLRRTVTIEEAIEIWVKNSRIDRFTPYAPRMETILRKVQKALGCSREPAWRRVVSAVKKSDHLEWVIDNKAHFIVYRKGEVKEKLRHVDLNRDTPTKTEETPMIDIYAMLCDYYDRKKTKRNLDE